MAQAQYKTLLGKVLLGFVAEENPVLAMLEWVAHQMMLIQAEGGPGSRGQAQKRRKLPGPLLPSKKKITKNIHFRPQRPSKLPDKLYEGAVARETS